VRRPCLVVSFTLEGVEIHALYRAQDGPGPNTKTSRRQVTELDEGHRRRANELLSGWEHGEGIG
jgi:hypothetical protein